MRTPSPWTSTYGLARSLIALSPLVTLLMHDPVDLFAPFGTAHADAPGNPVLFRLSLFGVLPFEFIDIARWVAIAILLLVVVGWRPRWTGILHWWVMFSFATSSFVLEGGDHIGMLLALFLVPVTLTDSRTWHWAEPPERSSWWSGPVARSCMVVIRFQAAVVYFHAASGKVVEPDWSNGTAIYYWLADPIFGAPSYLQPIVEELLRHPGITAGFTWGTIVLEALLCCGLLASPRWRAWLLVLGLVFHLGIAGCIGLVTFFFPMAALLILYLRWPDDLTEDKPHDVLNSLRSGLARPAPRPVLARPVPIEEST